MIKTKPIELSFEKYSHHAKQKKEQLINSKVCKLGKLKKRQNKETGIVQREDDRTSFTRYELLQFPPNLASQAEELYCQSRT